VTVLGGLGFLGSHLCRALLREGFSVRVVTRQFGSYELVSDIRSQLDVFETDIGQPEEVLDLISGSEIVIDLVHTTRPGSSMRDPVYDVTSNVVSHVQWLQKLARADVKRILFVSSGGTVYGIPEYSPIDEHHPTNPICSYGITKLVLEKYLAMYAELAGVEFTIVRPANAYGPGNRLNVGQGVIGVLADRALRGRPLEIWGTGEFRRDYLYVDDLVSALVGLVSYHGPHRVFNVSSGQGSSVLEVVDVLREVIGELPPVIHVPSREFDVRHNVLSSDRLRDATGWTAEVDLKTGVTRLIRWLEEMRSKNSQSEIPLPTH
jgi:UDP-glucose 4-epimerase